jgi:hypothetical protein
LQEEGKESPADRPRSVSMRRVTAAVILWCAGCASYFSSTPDPETIKESAGKDHPV